MTTFNDIITDEKILKAIHSLGFTTPTDIQAQTIPPALKGKDLIGQAKTGSGKTLAFGVPMLASITRERKPQALVLAPTRELCQQIAIELGKLAKYSDIKVVAIFGGVSIRPQFDALRDAQIIVATPGRLCDHLERRSFKTDFIKFLVFDEADRMFDMGFMNDMEHISKQLPVKRQTLLFSATMPDAIRKLVAKYQVDPVHIKTNTHVDEALLPQFFCHVDGAGKFSLLVHLIKKENPNLAIVFCPTKHGAKSLAKNLSMQGIESDAMHGNLSQSQRDNVISEFKKGKIRVLVATDVAARGLDVKHVSHVFNYDVSKSAEDYIHRIGRTARAGAEGKAITFVESSDRYAWRDILRLPNVKVTELKTEGVERIDFKKQPRGYDDDSRGAPRGMSNRQSRDRDRVGRMGDRSRPFGRREERSDSGFSSSSSGSFRSKDEDDRHASAAAPASRFAEKPRHFGEWEQRPAHHARPASASASRFDSERPRSYGHSSSSAPERAPRPFQSNDRPVRDNNARASRFAEVRPFGERKSYGDRSGDRKPFGNSASSYGDRKPFGDRSPSSRPSYGDRKPFSDRPSFGEKKPFAKRDDGKGFAPKAGFSKDRFSKSSDSRDAPRSGPGPRKPNAARRPLSKRFGSGNR